MSRMWQKGRSLSTRNLASQPRRPADLTNIMHQRTAIDHSGSQLTDNSVFTINHRMQWSATTSLNVAYLSSKYNGFWPVLSQYWTDTVMFAEFPFNHPFLPIPSSRPSTTIHQTWVQVPPKITAPHMIIDLKFSPFSFHVYRRWLRACYVADIYTYTTTLIIRYSVYSSHFAPEHNIPVPSRDILWHDAII